MPYLKSFTKSESKMKQIKCFCSASKVKQCVNLICQVPTGKFTFPVLFKPLSTTFSHFLNYSVLYNKTMNLKLFPVSQNPFCYFFFIKKAQKLNAEVKINKVYEKSNFLLEFFILNLNCQVSVRWQAVSRRKFPSLTCQRE